MPQTSKYIRLKKVISVLFKYGVDEILNRTNLVSHLPNVLKPTEQRQADIQNTPWTTRIRLALEELGPAYVKLGQIMSTRPDIIPVELIEELERLQDQVLVDDIDIEQILRAEYAPELFDRITDLAPTPLASASISQVYTGKLDGDKPVIFKIQRPEARQHVLADIQLMRDLVILVEKIDGSLKNMNFLQLIDTFEQNMIAELNFILEKENSLVFKEQNQENENVRVPQIYDEFCTTEVLCIEQMFGVRISEFNAYPTIPITTDELIHNYVDTFLDQVLINGFFHADPHPGNVFVDENGKIIFIDYGSMGSLNKHEINAVQNILIYFLLKNTEKLIEVVKGLALDYDIPDERKLKQQVDELVNIFSSRDINKVDFKVLIDKFTEISKKNRITFPHSIYLLVRGLALIEGTVRQLIPEINLAKMFKPHLLKLISGKLNRESLFNNLIPMGLETMDVIRQLPTRVNRLSEALVNGDLIIQTKNSAETEQYAFKRIHLIGGYSIFGICLVLLFVTVFYTSTWSTKELFIVIFISSLMLLSLTKIRNHKG